MLEGTYVGFPMLWVPNQAPRPRSMPHKATHFTVATVLQQQTPLEGTRNTHVLARRVAARLHRLVAEGLLSSNLPQEPGTPIRSLQALLQEASAAVVGLCTQHVVQHGAF